MGDHLKRAIVYWADTIDATLDAIPDIEKHDGKWKFYRFGYWGCRWGIANWGYGWEQKWRDEPFVPGPYQYDVDGKKGYSEKVQIVFLWTCFSVFVAWAVTRKY